MFVVEVSDRPQAGGGRGCLAGWWTYLGRFPEPVGGGPGSGWGPTFSVSRGSLAVL